MADKMKKSMRVIISVMMLLIYNYITYFSYCVEEITAPVETSIISNFSMLILIIVTTFAVLFLLSLAIKVMTGKKIFTGKFLSNKFVRFVEVSLFISIVIFLISEYIEVWKKYYSIGGIVLAVFGFYQRVSNKNRKIGYISLIMTLVIYAIFKMFG